MTYVYRTKGKAELQGIATAVLARFPAHRNDRAVDIERIIEDLGVDILPRRGFKKYAEGYLASDPTIIVVDERMFTYMPRARFTLAEEISHLILEYDLWQDSRVIEGGSCHEIDEKQHQSVERDAKKLASFLLMPDDEFRLVFGDKVRELRKNGITNLHKINRAALQYTAGQFDVSPQSAAYKSFDLRLVDRDDYPV